MLIPKIFNELTNNKIVDEYERLNQDLTNEIISLIIPFDEINKNYIKKNSNKIFKLALNKTQKLTKLRNEEIVILFDTLLNEQLKGYKSIYESKNLEFNISNEMKKIIDTSIKNVNKELGKLNLTIADSTKHMYDNAIKEVSKELIKGSTTLKRVVEKATNKLASQGITLKTQNNRKEKIETAVKRSIRKQTKITADSLAKQIGKEIDYNCVRIGHSSTCRPTHHIIDDVTMSKDEFLKYEYLTEEWNCNHIVNYLWLEEFEKTNKKILYGEDHLPYEDVIKNYNIQQKANYYARQVKEKKSEIVNGNNSNAIKKELRNAQSKYRIYCQNNNLTIDYDKTWKIGYNKNRN